MTQVLLGVGSNVEPRFDHIRTALDLLQEGGQVRLLKVAEIRETDPVGGPPQGRYLNTAALVESDIGPRDLLHLLKAVEHRVGRREGNVRWGPREVDLDILLYGDRVLQEPGLTVPHPRMTARRFVLEPAAEIAGDMLHPLLRKPVRELLRSLPGSRAGAPRLIRSLEELRGWVRTGRRNRFTTGLVPTMGALHPGHCSLMQAAYRENDRCIASIFVNPKQFDDAGDLDRYPRTLEDDLLLAADCGVDAMFAPETEEMYPPGFATRVEVTGLTDVLEGAHRPGHFTGVTTVVCKLLAMTLPDRAYFGQKDFQQAVVVRRMVQDLGIPCSIVVMPTVRDADGLATSSRNRFLSAEERQRALAVPRALDAAAEAWSTGSRDAATVVAAVREALAGLDVDYVALADPETLAPLEGTPARAVLLVAARVGATRLIDNVRLG